MAAVMARQYHPSASRWSYKDDQDREALRPRPSDGTKSGSDDQVAEKKVAFDPKSTDPQDAKDSAGRESNGNPLEASGANQEFSKPHNPEEAAERLDRKARSGGSQGKKHGNVGPM